VPDPVPIKPVPIRSPKGIISLAVIFGYVLMWSFAVYYTVTGDFVDSSDRTGFLLEFAGASGVMGMITILIVQNYFRKTEAA